MIARDPCDRKTAQEWVNVELIVIPESADCGGENDCPHWLGLECSWHRYRFPLARLCDLQSIWQFSGEVAPPLLQAATWSASMSSYL